MVQKVQAFQKTFPRQKVSGSTNLIQSNSTSVRLSQVPVAMLKEVRQYLEEAKASWNH